MFSRVLHQIGNFPWGRLSAKIIAWSFVPTALILLAVALVAYFAYQQVTEELVIQRDEDLVRLAAGQIATEMSQYADDLTVLARTADIASQDPAVRREGLKAARLRLAAFDSGVLILDTLGTVVATQPERPDILGQNWSDRPYYREIVRREIAGAQAPYFSDIRADGSAGARVIGISVPILGERGEFLGTLIGMFRLGATSVSAFYGDIVKLRIGSSGETYIVDGTGSVIYHSQTSRIGEDFSDQAVVQQVLTGQVQALRTRDGTGTSIVASYAPVPGTDWGLVVEETWASLTQGSRQYQRSLLLLLVAGVIVPMLVVMVGVGRITRPIVELSQAARDVARGNFGKTIDAKTGDEVEELTHQFNLMSLQLQESYATLEQRVADRTRELAALNAIALTVSQSLDLDSTLNDALDKTLQVMGTEAGGIYLTDVDAHELHMVVARGFSPEFVSQIDRLKVGEGFSGRVAQSGEPVVVRDVSADPRLTRLVVRAEGLRSLASVPISVKGRVLGTLFTITHGYRQFVDQDVELLTSIGHQIGIAVENARLYEQAQALAVEEERNRLARDLHDAVTQTLFSASMLAEVVPDTWRADPDEGQRLLNELRSLNRGALAEMRTLLLELRPAVLVEAQLGDLLRQLAEAVAGRTGTPVEVTVSGQCDLAEDVHVALYRIAQESLNNVVKHAQARHIWITLRCTALDNNGRDKVQDTRVQLRIVDDGIGFDLRNAPRDHLGLGIIRERAQAIGAELKIESGAGQGTEIAVTWVG